MRRWLVILLALLIIPVSRPVLSGGTQQDDEQGFYIITSNNENRDTTLWRIDQTKKSIDLVYSVTTLQSISPRDAFPDDEITVFDQHVSDGHLFYLHTDQSTTSRHIDRAWALDSRRILVLERVEACNVIDNICYGYHDFKLVDTTSGEETGIYQISYHGDTYNGWQCRNQRGLTIGEVFPNPQYDQFAITVKSYSCNSESSRATAGYIVDFSTLPARITYLPEAGGISWSPDGTYLAYFTQPACFVGGDSTMNVLPVNLDAPVMVLHKEPQVCQNTMFTAWLDNEIVMYAWKAGVADGDILFDIFRHNIITDEMSSSPLDVSVSSDTIFSLQDGAIRNTLGLRFRNSSVEYSATDETVLTDLEIEEIFYNSRLNSYAFINLQSNSVTRLDADLTTTSIDLSPLLADYAQEKVIYVTPGYAME